MVCNQIFCVPTWLFVVWVLIWAGPLAAMLLHALIKFSKVTINGKEY